MEEASNNSQFTDSQILPQLYETETPPLTPESNQSANILLIKEEKQQLTDNQQDQKVQNVEYNTKNKRKRNKKFQNRIESRYNHKRNQQNQLISLENTIQQEHISNQQNLPYNQNLQKEQVYDSQSSQSIQSTSKEILLPTENLTQLSSKSLIGEEQELFIPKVNFINLNQQQVQNIKQSSQIELDKTIQNSSNVEMYQKEEVEEEETQSDGLISQKTNKSSKPTSVSNSIEESDEKSSFNQNFFDQQHELTPTSASLENNTILEQNLYDFYKDSSQNSAFYTEYQSSPKESFFSFNKTYQFQGDKQDNFLDSWKQSSHNQMMFANPFYEPNALNELLQDKIVEDKQKQMDWRNDNFKKNEEYEEYEDEELPEWESVEVRQSDANFYAYNQGRFVYK